MTHMWLMGKVKISVYTSCIHIQDINSVAQVEEVHLKISLQNEVLWGIFQFHACL